MKWALLVLSLGALIACGGEEGEEGRCFPALPVCHCDENPDGLAIAPDPMRCHYREDGCWWMGPDPEPGTYTGGPCGAGGWCDCWLECVEGRCLDLRSLE